jgi:hypothetical protein
MLAERRSRARATYRVCQAGTSQGTSVPTSTRRLFPQDRPRSGRPPEWAYKAARRCAATSTNDAYSGECHASDPPVTPNRASPRRADDPFRLPAGATGARSTAIHHGAAHWTGSLRRAGPERRGTADCVGGRTLGARPDAATVSWRTRDSSIRASSITSRDKPPVPLLHRSCLTLALSAGPTVILHPAGPR